MPGIYPGTLYEPNVNAQSFQDAYAVTPSDAVDLAQGVTRGIYVGGTGGTLKVTMASGNIVTFTIPVAALGFTMDLCVTRIWATGTACTLIIALY